MTDLMNIDEETMKEATVIYQGLYGRGHGKRVTFDRFMSVLNLSEEDAVKLFYHIHNLHQ